jgi:Ni,Fe-hydrogenase I cytochrome b subunit
MAFSGLFLEFYKALGVSKDFAHSIKEIHEMIFYFIAFFVLAHISGVVIADVKEERGLISSMINGYDIPNKY